MSKHFKISLGIILGLALVLVGLFHVAQSRIATDFPRLAAKPSPVLKLPANDKEVLSINSNKHTITLLTASGTKTEFAKNPVITEANNGKITITRNVFGFETSPYLGASYGDRLRFNLGVDMFYVYRFDIGVSGLLANGGSNVFRLGATLSYNLYNNTSLFIGVDNQKSPIGGLKVRF